LTEKHFESEKFTKKAEIEPLVKLHGGRNMKNHDRSVWVSRAIDFDVLKTGRKHNVIEAGELVIYSN